MMSRIHRTARLGDLIEAAFDEADTRTSEPVERSRIATQIVVHILRHARRATLAIEALSRWESEGGSIPATLAPVRAR